MGATAFVLSGVPGARADFTPTRPIEIVAHNGPGSGPDLLARAMSQVIEQAHLCPVRFTVLNKTGGGSTNASSYLMSKRGSPYTLGIYTSVWVIDPLLQTEATTLITDVTPIARLILEPALVVVVPDSPFKSVGDFIDAAKAAPDKYKQSGGSITSRENILRQQIMKKTGAKWVYVSFPSGGERLSALLGGHVDLMIVDPGEAGELVRGGKVRILAQVADQRLDAYKDVPTLKEAGYDVGTFQQVRGVVGPPDLPADAVAYDQDLFTKMAQQPAWAKYLDENHFINGYMPADETKVFLKEYEAQIRGLLTDAGVKVVR